jgi:hypothetical protein
MDQEGNWVFVPKPKWETLPASFYSLRNSQIYLSLFKRGVSPELIDYCLEQDLLPPARLRRARVEAWIRSHAARRVRRSGQP